MHDALLAGVAAAGDGGLEAVPELGLERQQRVLTRAAPRPVHRRRAQTLHTRSRYIIDIAVDN